MMRMMNTQIIFLMIGIGIISFGISLGGLCISHTDFGKTLTWKPNRKMFLSLLGTIFLLLSCTRIVEKDTILFGMNEKTGEITKYDAGMHFVSPFLYYEVMELETMDPSEIMESAKKAYYQEYLEALRNEQDKLEETARLKAMQEAQNDFAKEMEHVETLEEVESTNNPEQNQSTNEEFEEALETGFTDMFHTGDPERDAKAAEIFIWASVAMMLFTGLITYSNAK